MTVKEWFSWRMAPVLEDVSKKIVDGGLRSGADTAFGEWWAVFTKDTFALFEIIEKENQTRQFAMTVRSLIEFASDVSFLTNNPRNIGYQKRRAERFVSKGKYSYKDIAVESKKYKLRKYGERGNRDLVNTEDRIRMAFGENIVVLYDYLNCFSHFNIFGVRIDLNIHQAKDDSMLRERLTLLQFYPEIFEVMVRSMGVLCSADELADYDYSEIREIFDSIPKEWRFADS